jgi:hypothetical protein
MYNMGMQEMDEQFKAQDRAHETQKTLELRDYCINGIDIRALYFVDDIGVWRLHEDPRLIRIDYKTFDKHLSDMGVSTNGKKTAIITTCRKRKNKVKNIGLHTGQMIPVQEKTRYLGSIISSNGSSSADMEERITQARVAFFKLTKTWRSSSIPLTQKLRIYSSAVLAVLLYSSEVRAEGSNKTMLIKFETFHSYCLRYIASLWRKGTNLEVRKELKQPSIDTLMTNRRLTYWRSVGANPDQKPIVASLFVDKFHWEKDKGNPMYDTLSRDLASLPGAQCDTYSHHNPASLLVALSTLTRGVIKQNVNPESRFDRQDNLAVIDDDARKTACDLCQKKFFDKRGLYAHLRRTHKRPHPVRSLVQTTVCPHCKKQFASLDAARNHFQHSCYDKLDPQLLHALAARSRQIPVQLGRSARKTQHQALNLVHLFQGIALGQQQAQ